MKKKILIRADGNEKLGIGHITRCLYFLLEFKDKYNIFFFIKQNKLISDFISSHDIKVLELDPSLSLQEEIDALQNISSDLLILDIRGENDKYYQVYSENFKKVLMFDDSDKAINVFSTFYLNYNLYTEDIRYNLINKNCELFLGPSYYIFNPIFKKYKNFKRNFEKDSFSILITMGGGDPKSLTVKIIKAIVSLRNVHFNVILGKLFENFNEIKRLKTEYPSKISLFQNIKNMHDMMAENDIIITTGGNTSFEAAFMGIPGILVNQIKIQNKNGIFYDKQKIFLNAGLGEDITEEQIRGLVQKLLSSIELRRRLSINGRKLFQTEGTKIVLEKFINYNKMY